MTSPHPVDPPTGTPTQTATGPARGRFVALEGGDGAGKSTQLALLATWLREAGLSVVTTREPGGTSLGVSLREVLLHSGEAVSPRAEALLFAADRAQHVAHLLEPSLAAGEWVVTDRYSDSSIAYQGAGRALDRAEIASLSAWATGGLTPDLTVLLDVPTDIGAARRAGPADRMESAPDAFHAQVRQGFLDLAAAAPQRYLVLDATESPQEIAAAIRESLQGWVPAPTAPQTRPDASPSESPDASSDASSGSAP